MSRFSISVLLLISAILALFTRTADAQNVSISMNVFPASVAAPNSGGVWTLVAKTDQSIGISGIQFYLLGIDVSGISYGPNIGADWLEGNPFIIPGSPIDFVYTQSPFDPATLGVGTPSFNADPDPLGDANWDHATLIAKGSYSGNVPSFSSKDGKFSDGNLYSSTEPPHLPAIDPVTTTTVRIALTGDYNLDGSIDAADYTLWRDSLGTFLAATSGADASGNATVDASDYQIWRNNYGATPPGSTTLAPIPEPTTLLLVSFLLFAPGRTLRKAKSYW